MFVYNPTTKEITIPQGDTGIISVALADADGQPFSPALTGYGVFGICQKARSGLFGTVESVFSEISGNTLVFTLTNEMTSNLPVGEYYYDIRLVLGGSVEDGKLITDSDLDEVHSLYSVSGMPKCTVTGVSYDVLHSESDEE